MPAGRPPKPIELKRRTGNPGRRPLPDKAKTVALVPSDGAPVPLALKAAGREVWARAQDHAIWLSRLDLMLLEILCKAVDQHDEMNRLVAEDGLVQIEPIVTPAGHVVGEKKVANPLLKELRALEKQIHSSAAALGFDPTSRSRLGLAEVKRQSALAEFDALHENG
jgi:P27 family predicted phage terminase small subunit